MQDSYLMSWKELYLQDAARIRCREIDGTGPGHRAGDSPPRSRTL